MAIDEDFRAILASKEAVSLRPEWSEGWLTLGRAQLNLGEPSLALESLSTASKLDPNNSEIQEELARTIGIEETLRLGNVDTRAAAAAARSNEAKA
mmetsp:Transcript_41228/g.53190  ORF Transcript_41228/g.53190 Transcript_41228/m.53190 type:complete len:96 (+) Transcript_41228:52-339(+)